MIPDNPPQRDIPDDIRPDAPLDVVGVIVALQFQLERLADTVDRLVMALEKHEQCRDSGTNTASPSR